MRIKILDYAIRPRNENEFRGWLEFWNGKEVVLSTEEYTEKGGHGYDKFYFGFVIPVGIQFFRDSYDEYYSPDECHYIFKLMFHSGIMQHPKTKEQMKYAKEYSKLSNRGKETYITEVRNYLHSKTGSYIETPWERPNA